MSTDRADSAVDANIEFSVDAEQPGLELFDRIERHHLTLATAAPVDPSPAPSDAFGVPVDRAVVIRTSAFELPNTVDVHVQRPDGDVVTQVNQFGEASLPAGEYLIGLSTPVKTYLRVEAPVTVEKTVGSVRVAFEDETRVLVGARSRHENPAATITTTGSVPDMMRAVSAFGSALKTLRPERSYPTLRGHPPLVELGDTVEIPSNVTPPDSGVTLVVPPDRQRLYAAAPLAFYLGAEVVPGPEPRIATDTGFEHSLDTERGYEGEIERVLKQTFFLDCVTRNEGPYGVELHERGEVETGVDLDFADLYDRSLSEQLAAYLSVPYGVVEDQVPEWSSRTHLDMESQRAELLPFLVDDLAVIRSEPTQTSTTSPVKRAAIDDFTRGGSESADRSAAASGTTADPDTTASPETPIDAVEAHQNRLAREPADGSIQITVVCNDSEMTEEQSLVEDAYGSREALPFDVTVERQLTAAELEVVLAGSRDFLHYIGHIDDEGFECADGRLDATELSSVGVDAFFLNACQSRRQGAALIDGGSIGGVVTDSEIVNSGAVRVGATLARLLNRGFPIRDGLDIASDQSVIGSQYEVVGDGGFSIVQAESRTPYVVHLSEAGPQTYELSLELIPTRNSGLGTVFTPNLRGISSSFLNSGEQGPFTLSAEEVKDFLKLEKAPVNFRGNLRWSNEVRDELR